MYIPQKHGVPLAERPLAHTVDAPIGAGSSDRFWDDPSIKLAVDLTWKEENEPSEEQRGHREPDPIEAELDRKLLGSSWRSAGCSPIAARDRSVHQRYPSRIRGMP
jgi:hypothetical protein